MASLDTPLGGDPFRFELVTTAGDFLAKLGTQTEFTDVDGLSGTTVFVGRACDADPAVPDAQEGQIAACLDDTPRTAPIAIGTKGAEVSDVGEQFDGWGYAHLFNSELQELDTFAIPEAMDEAFADGFGDLTVHEVATDPQDPSLAHLSYYDAGIRAVQIQCSNPADESTCELVEVGGFVDLDTDGSVPDVGGTDFWGAETFVGDGGFTYILGSDRDAGLWILRDP